MQLSLNSADSTEGDTCLLHASPPFDWTLPSRPEPPAFRSVIGVCTPPPGAVFIYGAFSPEGPRSHSLAPPKSPPPTTSPPPAPRRQCPPSPRHPHPPLDTDGVPAALVMVLWAFTALGMRDEVLSHSIAHRLALPAAAPTPCPPHSTSYHWSRAHSHLCGGGGGGNGIPLLFRYIYALGCRKRRVPPTSASYELQPSHTQADPWEPHSFTPHQNVWCYEFSPPPAQVAFLCPPLSHVNSCSRGGECFEATQSTFWEDEINRASRIQR